MADKSPMKRRVLWQKFGESKLLEKLLCLELSMLMFFVNVHGDGSVEYRLFCSIFKCGILPFLLGASSRKNVSQSSF